MLVLLTYYLYYLFFPARLTKNITIAITITEINIPTPIPVLKMPPTTAQLLNAGSRENNKIICNQNFNFIMWYFICF